jgi:hypothetical protein
MRHLGGVDSQPKESQKQICGAMDPMSRRFGTKVLAKYCVRWLELWLDSTKGLGRYPRCTIARHLPPRDSTQRNMEFSKLLGVAMQTGFDGWVGQSVVLQVALGDIKVPLRGKLLKEGGETVRMRIGDGWDVDIYKAMILGVEEDRIASIPA